MKTIQEIKDDLDQLNGRINIHEANLESLARSVLELAQHLTDYEERTAAVLNELVGRNNE